MDKMQTDAQKLFEKGKIEESLNIYEKIIRGRFDHYPKKLVQYHFGNNTALSIIFIYFSLDYLIMCQLLRKIVIILIKFEYNISIYKDSVEIWKKLIQCTKSKSEFKEESNNENNLVNIQVF